MTLARKIFWKNAAVLVGMILLGVAGLVGLRALRGDVHIALDEYGELRVVERTGLHLSAAQGLMRDDHPRIEAIAAEIDAAIAQIQQFDELQKSNAEGSPHHEEVEQVLGRAALSRLREVKAHLESEELFRDSRREQLAVIENVLADMNRMSREGDSLVAETQQRATRKLHQTMLAMMVLSIVIILAAIAVAVWQYHGVMRPLRRLREGVRSVAAGQLDQRLPTDGEIEFSDLSKDFNRMAEELDGLYRGLEEKVLAKSKELVRSERLASVGFLAAGVAHEINNPLNIISGYAELSLKQLRRDAPDSPAVNDAEQAMQIICEEAFRCKQIIEKLLSLAKPGSGSREPISLAHVAEDIGKMIRGLKQYRDRRLVIETGDPDKLIVNANENEMKQVLLNLVVNALESVASASGVVHIRGTRASPEWVQVSVSDNGCGMPPQVLERVFEPFFTAKGNSNSGRGVGLGMSITHAIIESHGGEIRAESDGVGRGSCFVIRLPAASASAVAAMQGAAP